MNLKIKICLYLKTDGVPIFVDKKSYETRMFFWGEWKKCTYIYKFVKSVICM